jgi:Domain of unknown function (DUF397)
MAPSTGPIDLTRAVWRKSTRSSSEGQNCVEVATNLPGIVAVRDSRHLAGRPLVVTWRNWAAFIRAIQAGTFASSPGELAQTPAFTITKTPEAACVQGRLSASGRRSQTSLP